jgi:penicillin amidase
MPEPDAAEEAPPLAERIAVEGLSADAEIVVDCWGIPHLRAQNLPDLFFLQGFNAARDRLWQIDLWRKRGLGLLAADFGPGFLAQDRASRLFLFRGDMAAEWAAYGPDTEAICTAFAAGINAYIALTEREPERLPPEFGTVNTKPARWSPADVVRIRSHGLTRNAVSEVLRANVLARSDAATDRLRRSLEPPVTPRIPDGLDLSAVPLHVLDVFKLATAAVTFTPERLAATLDEAWIWTKVTELGEVLPDQGSNNWVVAGSRTATGRPILASDPHRTHAVPSLRYLVHLTAPGFDAIGAGEPSVPGIAIGHNGRIAFGLTIFGTDQEDVYVYETEDGAADSYRYGDGWEAMRIEREHIAVRGAPDQEVVLKWTRHGPVVHEHPERRSAVAVRSVWFEPGSAAYLHSLASMRAGNLQGFREALRGWGAPSVNQVYADPDGTVAWMPVGKAPLRPNWDGLLPVPGDGSFEWAGFIEPDLFPCVVNPPEGYVATANELNLPPGWPHGERPVGFEWAERSRSDRIGEVLGGDGEHTVSRSCALQGDDLSIPARRLCRLLAPVASEDGDIDRALSLLAQWDHRLAAESAPAALFEVWWTKHLKPALLARLVPDAAVRSLIVPGDVESLLAHLEAPDARFGPDARSARDALLLDSLAEAWRDCAARMGEPREWAWGWLHHGYFEHALTDVKRQRGFDVGPLPKGGSGSTPMHAGYRPSDFRVTAGASFRMVVDVGNWDQSVCVNAPGQSGDSRSPHYRDLAPLWAAGRYVPMSYTREAVDASAETRLVLERSRAPTPLPGAPGLRQAAPMRRSR